MYERLWGTVCGSTFRFVGFLCCLAWQGSCRRCVGEGLLAWVNLRNVKSRSLFRAFSFFVCPSPALAFVCGDCAPSGRTLEREEEGSESETHSLREANRQLVGSGGDAHERQVLAASERDVTCGVCQKRTAELRVSLSRQKATGESLCASATTTETEQKPAKQRGLPV